MFVHVRKLVDHNCPALVSFKFFFMQYLERMDLIIKHMLLISFRCTQQMQITLDINMLSS